MTKFNNPFAQFPKQRPKLDPKIKKIYYQHYLNSREGRTATTAVIHNLESWMHKKVAEDTHGGGGNLTTLEIGAGTLNQLPYEPRVQAYDIVEPYTKLYRQSENLIRVRNKYKDIGEVSSKLKYERITSIATFEHITNLPEVVARAGLLLKPDGCLRVAIPNEGSTIWKLGWQLTSGIEFWIKYGLDYGQLMAYEHVNTAVEIREVLNCFFERVETEYLGIGHGWSIYHFYLARKPRIKLARSYLVGGR